MKVINLFLILSFVLSTTVSTAQGSSSVEEVSRCGLGELELVVQSENVDSVRWFIDEDEFIAVTSELEYENFSFNQVSESIVFVQSNIDGTSISVLSLVYNMEAEVDSIHFELTWFTELNDFPDISSGCEGDSIIFETEDQVLYNWSSNPSIDITDENGLLVLYPTESTVVIINSSNSICSRVDTISVQIYDRPYIELLDQSELCLGATTVISPIVTQATFYAWSPDEFVVNSTSPSPTIIPLESQYFYLNCSNEFGCERLDSIFILVRELPTLNAGEDVSICSGDTIQLDATSSDNFEWFPAIGMTDPESLQTEVTITTSQIYTLEASNEFGCSASDELVINVNDLPVLNINFPEAVCIGETLELTAQGAPEYIWMDNPNIMSVLNETAILTVENPSSYQFQGIDENGCADIFQFFIDTLFTPTPLIFGPNVICRYSSLVEYNSSYEWNCTTVWNIDGGEIVGNPYENTVYVSWLENPENCSIGLTMQNLQSNCSVEYIFDLNFEEGSAPLYSSIVQLSSNLLACSDQISSIYIWGKTNMFNGVEQVISEGSSYCYFSNLDISTFYYWVEHGNDMSCLTRTYFNIPSYYTGIDQVGSEEARINLKVAPNPTSDLIRFILPKDFYHDKLFVAVYSAYGDFVLNKKITSDEILDVSRLSPGVYNVTIMIGEESYSTAFIKI
jgi:hypothetical protein